MDYIFKWMVNISSHKKSSLLVIAIWSLGVAFLDSIISPEVPVEAFYTFPIWWGLSAFGLVGGLLVSTSSICLYYISNYFINDNRSPHIWSSVLLSYLFFLLFCFGAYRFLINQRQLYRTKKELQGRLEELDKLYQESQQLHRKTQLLHQNNLKLAVIEERNRLAREIHDVLAQGFTAIILQVEAAFVARDDLAALDQRLARINELAHHNLKEARHSVANLRPLPLEESSLIEGLEGKVQEFSSVYNIKAVFNLTGQLRNLSSETETGLYRIAQEALNNVVRHAEASLVEVNLDYDEDEVCLTIQDNGRGFETEAVYSSTINKRDQNKPSPTYGLSMMQERAGLIGGWATINSRPGEGCRIRVIVSYPKEKSNLMVKGEDKGLNVISGNGSRP